MTKKYKIEFAPGSFDDFEGTQEELDEFIAEIERMAEDGSLIENSYTISLADLFEQDEAAAVQLAYELGMLDDLEDEDGNPVTREMLEAALGVEFGATKDSKKLN